jgi:hypothetical protein
MFSSDRDDENREDQRSEHLEGYGDRKVWEGRKVNRFERIGRSNILGG